MSRTGIGFEVRTSGGCFLGKKYSSKLWNRDFHNGCSSEDLSSSRCNSGSRSTGGVTSTVAISEMSLSQSFFGGNNRFPRHPHIKLDERIPCQVALTTRV